VIRFYCVTRLSLLRSLLPRLYVSRPVHTCFRNRILCIRKQVIFVGNKIACFRIQSILFRRQSVNRPSRSDTQLATHKSATTAFCAVLGPMQDTVLCQIITPIHIGLPKSFFLHMRLLSEKRIGYQCRDLYVPVLYLSVTGSSN